MTLAKPTMQTFHATLACFFEVAETAPGKTSGEGMSMFFAFALLGHGFTGCLHDYGCADHGNLGWLMKVALLKHGDYILVEETLLRTSLLDTFRIKSA